jgi:hypothetical protein
MRKIERKEKEYGDGGFAISVYPRLPVILRLN